MLTRQEVNNWKREPVTKEVFRRFNEDVLTLMHNWANGQYKTFSEAEHVRGMIKGITMVLNMEGDEDE